MQNSRTYPCRLLDKTVGDISRDCINETDLFYHGPVNFRQLLVIFLLCYGGLHIY